MIFDVFLVFRRKLQRYCSETGEIFNSLSDAIRKCDATKNCDKIMNENCDSQGSFSICTENAIEYPSGPLGSCIYTRNYIPGKFDRKIHFHQSRLNICLFISTSTLPFSLHFFRQPLW